MARTSHPNRTNHSGHESAASCRAVGGIFALTRLLARQAAREFLEHADTDGADCEGGDEDRTSPTRLGDTSELGDMSRPANLRASPRAKTDTAGVPACSQGPDHEATG